MRAYIVTGAIALGFVLGATGALAQTRIERPGTLQFAAELYGMKGFEPTPDTNGTAPRAEPWLFLFSRCL